MLNPNVKQMLEVGKACGLTWLSEAYSNYTRNYDIFFNMNELTEQLITLEKELMVLNLVEKNGSLKKIEIEKLLK